MILALVLAAAPLSVERLHQAGLELSGPFSDAEIDALASGLDALPSELRTQPGPRMRLVLDLELPPTASGIAEPEWRTPNAFILTRQQGHVSFRDGSLSDDARLTLWRARAVVHAVLSRWEDQKHWSADPRWRRANGWLLPFERPLTLAERALNHASTAYARPRGMESARLDFLTFAQSALVPVTEKLTADDQLRCQDFTRSRALSALLGIELQSGACPVFDAWSRELELDHLEVLLVQSSGRAPESLFGHLLVRPVWKTSLGPSFDTAIQFAAITPPRPDLLHIGRGLFGGYSIGVFTVSMTDLEREKLSGEQRSMTRWKLSLSAIEMRRFLERAWEFERRGRFSYAFFSDNCATLLLWMLETSLEGDDSALVRWPGFITSPGAVLDDLFRAKRKTGERLLTALFPPMESTGVIARRADDRRMELERSIPFDFSGAHSTDVAIRAGAYTSLEQQTRAVDSRHHAALFRWWALSARVERAPADESIFELRKLEEELVEGVPLDLEALWTERLAKLERESVLQQQLMLLDRASFMDDLRRRMNRRPMTPGEASDVAGYEAQLALFEQVTSAQGALGQDVFDSASAAQFLEDEASAALAIEVMATTRSLPVSGHWRTGIGGGVWARANGAFTPVVRVDEAGLLELLGEQRHRGIGAPVGVRMLEGSFTLAPALVPFRVVQSHFTLVSFDSIAAPTRPALSLREHVGFGFELATDSREWRSQKTLYGGAGWVALHARDAAARNLVMLGIGPSLQVADDGVSPMPMAGGTARLIARIALDASWPSALRFEARHQSVWGPGRVMHELRGDASVEWVVAWGGRPRVLVRPTLSVTAEPTLGRIDALGLLMIEPAESLREIFARP